MRKLMVLVTTVALLGGTRVSRAEEGPFHGNIEQMTKRNSDFRHVLFTGRNVQVVAMALRAGEDIGEEVHTVDQCFFFVEGKAKVVANAKATNMSERGVFCVPAGVRHNVRNTGSGPLKLFTIYAPPQHPPKTVHRSKAEAERSEAKELPKTKK